MSSCCTSLEKVSWTRSQSHHQRIWQFCFAQNLLANCSKKMLPVLSITWETFQPCIKRNYNKGRNASILRNSILRNCRSLLFTTILPHLTFSLYHRLNDFLKDNASNSTFRKFSFVIFLWWVDLANFIWLSFTLRFAQRQSIQ